MELSVVGVNTVVSRLLVGTFWEAYLPIPIQGMTPSGLHCLMDLDGTLKGSPGAPGVSDRVFLDVDTADAGIPIEATLNPP